MITDIPFPIVPFSGAGSSSIPCEDPYSTSITEQSFTGVVFETVEHQVLAIEDRPQHQTVEDKKFQPEVSQTAENFKADEQNINFAEYPGIIAPQLSARTFKT
eukprot:6011798-Karenia_brevis.AAC.1